MSAIIPPFTLLLGNLSSSVQTVVNRLLRAAPELAVVGSAASADELSTAARRLRPGVVLLTEDQLSGLERLQQQFSVPVLLYSARTPLPGMLREVARLGVYDYITPAPTAAAELIEWGRQLRRKLLAVRPRPMLAAPPKVVVPRTRVMPLPPQGIVVIGGSTGGAPAAEALLRTLPADFPWAVLVAVHLPVHFTDTLVERLRRASQLPVDAAGSGSRLEAGRVLVAPGGRNLLVQPVTGSPWLGWETEFTSEASLDVPSVDLLMHSAARLAGRNVVGVVLTGLGHDGTSGAQAIRRAGGAVIVQDEATSAVFAMPKSVIQAGLATEVQPLASIAAALMRYAPNRSVGSFSRSFSRPQPATAL